jgi:hypothetical protein
MSLLTFFQKFIEFSNRGSVLNNIAFGTGFIWGYTTEKNTFIYNTIHFPITSVVSGIFSGCVTEFGAAFVGGFIPAPFKMILTGSLMISGGYYACYPKKNITQNNTLEISVETNS